MAPGSRRSVRSSTPIPMPVIAEDEISSDPTRAGATTPTPTVPPRSPHRRSSTISSSYMGFSTNSSTNQSTSAASFRWIIRPVTTYSYVISSSDDPFSPTGTFKDVNPTMIDANQASERLTFSFTMAKAVVPDVTVTTGSSNSSVSWTAVFDSISHDDDDDCCIIVLSFGFAACF
ncbi:hypothetical protein QBC45DRAFT_457693 [Copromyces sp. CBS 386.78]|nr:hypothetical protein QBC45DRAFT_457693 [Copromyces sp. CBS 386.78]